MKRFHVHVAVDELESSIHFYRALFGAEPTVRKPNYAKWMLDDPAVNFAISVGEADKPGVSHLGLQVDDDHTLAEIADRLHAAGVVAKAEPGADCCYAHSNKHWAVDPSGVAWEGFHTVGAIEKFGAATIMDAAPCCAKRATSNPRCCAG